MNNFTLHKDVSIEFETPDNLSFKFGYYNYSPLNKNGDKLLAHKIDFEGRLPLKDDEIEIGFFDLNKREWFPLANSSAFNWQQCSMLQWLGPDFNDRIIFNDYENGNYISRIININTLEEQRISKAIYAVHPSGKFSISLNFERSTFTRAYSYACEVDQGWEDLSPSEDNIFLVNLVNNTYREIINLEKIIEFDGSNEYKNKHWFEHIMLNESGNRFAFYHRFETERGFFTKCITADTNGNNLWNVPISGSELISHLGWKNDNEFVIFTRTISAIQQAWVGKATNKPKEGIVRYIYRKFIKPLIPQTVKAGIIPEAPSFYSSFIDTDGLNGKIEVVPHGMDGHPSFSSCKRYLLTDTYADDNGYRHLLLHNLITNKTLRLGSFFSYYNNSNWRADLHPRFSFCNTKVIIDLNHSGITGIAIIDISKIKLDLC